MTEPAADPVPTRRAPRLVLIGVLTLQILVLVGFAGFYLYELVLGQSSSPSRVVMSIVLIIVFAVGLGAVARAWAREEDWARTPSMVWSVLLLPVAWGLVQGQRPGLGALVGAAGLVGLGAALTATAGSGPGPADRADADSPGSHR